ncbi:hypothetical protein IE81DRAFT_24239 [Ceraceosorus guamensis]|uniref:Secreted protein n=1 Tax=Ceraceosorus guamensis TaxID=1522189 RepID=A0A316VPN4_9BASI|nr:hypothetical protein IE81DRAFT_24239 [Ceraceosorus guamensis]PWN39482.1 hypothetical protein IE81DRAFT_24239 [Ceraceosorus guamensis]
MHAWCVLLLCKMDARRAALCRSRPPRAGLGWSRVNHEGEPCIPSRVVSRKSSLDTLVTLPRSQVRMIAWLGGDRA